MGITFEVRLLKGIVEGDRERGSERGNNLNEIKKLKRDFQTNKFNKDFTVVHEFDFQIVCGP